MKTKTTADMKFVNGHVVTLDPSVPEASALAVSQGLIVAVGADEEVLRHGSGGAEVVDLHGRTLVPGLIDSHVHAFATGMLDIAADLRAASSVEEVCSALTPTGEHRNDHSVGLRHELQPVASERGTIPDRCRARRGCSR